MTSGELHIIAAASPLQNGDDKQPPTQANAGFNYQKSFENRKVLHRS